MPTIESLPGKADDGAQRFEYKLNRLSASACSVFIVASSADAA
jgi:hypothetical protein